MSDMFPMQLVGEAAEAVALAVNQQIDSRLEGFVKSTFEWHIHCVSGLTIPASDYSQKGLPPGETFFISKLHCGIRPDEMQILLRRLYELGDEGDWEAESLADDIVRLEYGVEIV